MLILIFKQEFQPSAPILPWLLATLLILCVILIAARSYRPLIRKPTKQRIALKVIFGTVGIGVLIAFAANTLISADNSYKAPSGPEYKVLVPLNDPAPIPEPTSDDKEEIKKMRLLVHMVICKTFPSNFPVNAKVFDIQWPRDRNNDLKWELTLDDEHVKTILSINSISSVKSDNTKLYIKGSRSVSMSSASRSMNCSGSFNSEDFNKSQPQRISEQWQDYVFFTPILDNDPLKEISLADFLKMHSNKLKRVESSVQISDPSLFSIMNHLGLFGLLLIVSTICLAQLFPHKVLGFAGVLAAVVIFTAILDRITLSEHLARVKDKSLPIETRMSACDKSANTLFYPKTCRKEMADIADDSSAPEDLRFICKQIALGLDDQGERK